jgi:outer membrane protein assembly factor BamB
MDHSLYVVASSGQVCCLEAENGTVQWTFDLAGYTQTRPQLLSSPALIHDPDAGGTHHRIYFATELRNPVSSAAVLYCLRD